MLFASKLAACSRPIVLQSVETVGGGQDRTARVAQLARAPDSVLGSSPTSGGTSSPGFSTMASELLVDGSMQWKRSS